MESFDVPLSDFEDLIRRALLEDAAHQDITSAACVDEGARATGEIILKEGGWIAGLKFVPRIFQLFDERIECKISVREGAACEKGTVLARAEGPARSLLSAERVALNFLQHLCGVASLTARCVALVQGTKCKILDTRKTILGLRALQKYAVRIGGGTNHRLHLGERILIKNNHLALAGRHAASPLFHCVRSARLKHPNGWIEVEIGAPEELMSALDAGADAILLDNMSPKQVSACAAMNDRGAFLEASGGIHLANAAEYAAAGVDGISIGALTHSAPALDICMRIR